MLGTLESPVESQELLWRQYALSVELFKHYMKLAIEFNVFYYAITGAILSYYFAHQSEPVVRYALVFPALLSSLFGGFFFYASRLVPALDQEVRRIRDALNLSTVPDLRILGIVLKLFAILMFIVAVALIVLMCAHGA